jgi:hypothetical protein
VGKGRLYGVSVSCRESRFASTLSHLSGPLWARSLAGQPRDTASFDLARFTGSIADISDHTIVTSDSLGSVTFWDGASMAQKQHFSAHKADGMCLLVGPVSPRPPLRLSSSSSMYRNQRRKRRGDIGKEVDRAETDTANDRTERQSSPLVQTNESVNSPTYPRPRTSP